MTFKDATEGIPAPELARAFGVSAQTVRQYRLDPSFAGHRAPPKNWRLTVAGVLQAKGEEFMERARALTDG